MPYSDPPSLPPASFPPAASARVLAPALFVFAVRFACARLAARFIVVVVVDIVVCIARTSIGQDARVVG
jgi:hypothetical protein